MRHLLIAILVTGCVSRGAVVVNPTESAPASSAKAPKKYGDAFTGQGFIPPTSSGGGGGGPTTITTTSPLAGTGSSGSAATLSPCSNSDAWVEVAGVWTCTSVLTTDPVSGTAGDLAIFSAGGATVGNYAGSAATACVAGSVDSGSDALSASGGLTTACVAEFPTSSSTALLKGTTNGSATTSDVNDSGSLVASSVPVEVASGQGSAAAGYLTGIGVRTLPAWQSGYWYVTPYWAATAVTTNAAPANGTLRCYPFELPNAITVSAVAAEVTATGDSSSTIELAIYSDTGFGYPHSLVLDAGHIAGNSATVQTITGLSTAMQPGLYWGCSVLQNETTTQPTLRVPSAQWSEPYSIGFGTSTPTAGQTMNGWAQTGVTGSLPTTFSSSLVNIGNFGARIFIKPQ